MKRNKITGLLPGVILAVGIYSCTDMTPTPISGRDFLNELRNMHLLNNYNGGKPDIDIDSVNRTLLNNGMVYILNSSCSVCIGLFLTFAEMYKEMNCKDSLYVIIDEQDSTTIAFYMEQIQIKDRCIGIIKNNSVWHVKDMQELNGDILLLQDRKIINGYKYTYE